MSSTRTVRIYGPDNRSLGEVVLNSKSNIKYVLEYPDKFRFVGETSSVDVSKWVMPTPKDNYTYLSDFLERHYTIVGDSLVGYGESNTKIESKCSCSSLDYFRYGCRCKKEKE